MKKFALLGAIAISALMVGCSSTETRDDSSSSTVAVCPDGSNCDASTCDKPDCAKKAQACAKKSQACANGAKACPSAAGKACSHPNTAFKCDKCKPGQPCCADCAAKAAAMCPDCAAKAAMACPDCKDGKMCAKCKAKMDS